LLWTFLITPYIKKTDEIRKIGSFESAKEIEDEEDNIKDEFEVRIE